MISVGVLSASCLRLLSTLDALVAMGLQAQGCPHCGGRLDASHFTRKTRGLCDDDGPAGLQRRWSWCCARDGCRKRLTTPSVRFLGPKVYAGFAVACLQCLQPRSSGESHLRRETGCSRQSVARWRDHFTAIWSTSTGRAIAHLFPVDALQGHQPGRILASWMGPWPYLVARWHLIIHSLTGGRHWPPGGSYHPLNAQKMDFGTCLAELHDGSFMF
jgi:hypothetical protein